MLKITKIGLLIGFMLFTGCLKREHTPIPSELFQTRNPIVLQAYRELGKPYKYGAVGPNSFDCSGFVYAVHKKLGIMLPRTSLAQSKIAGRKIPRTHLRVGDLVFFDTASRGHVNHVGIYLGRGKFIHASSGKAFSVTISDINAWYKDKFKWGKRIYADK